MKNTTFGRLPIGGSLLSNGVVEPFAFFGRLFRAQRGHRADPSGAAGGEPGGEQGGDGEGEGSKGEGDRIERADFVEHAAQNFAGAGGEEQADHDAAQEHDGAFAHDHAQNGAGLRAESHANPNLARPSRNGIRFHAVKTDDSKTQREAAEDGEHRGTGTDDPELEIAVEMLRETFQRQDRQRGIDFAHGPAQQIGGVCFTAGGEGMEPDKEGDIALKSARERKVDLAVRIFFEEPLFRRWNDADDLDRFFSSFATEIAGHADAFRVVFGAGSVVARVLDALAKGIAFGPKFFRKHFIDDSDHRAARLSGFGLVENAAAQHRQTDGGEVISADAVPSRAEGEAFGGSRRLCIRRRLHAGALDVSAERDHPERDRGRDAGVLDAGQRREAFLEVAIKILGAFLVVTGQARIRFEKETRAGREAGVDRSGFAGAPDEERGGGEQRE